MVFATLTAPSYGPVHTTRGRGERCQRRRRPATCPHGCSLSCERVHAEVDPEMGSPLCEDCYDYAGHAAFNWYAPELWRRFTIALRRRIAAQLGVCRSKLEVEFLRTARTGAHAPTETGTETGRRWPARGRSQPRVLRRRASDVWRLDAERGRLMGTEQRLRVVDDRASRSARLRVQFGLPTDSGDRHRVDEWQTGPGALLATMAVLILLGYLVVSVTAGLVGP